MSFLNEMQGEQERQKTSENRGQDFLKNFVNFFLPLSAPIDCPVSNVTAGFTCVPGVAAKGIDILTVAPKGME